MYEYIKGKIVEKTPSFIIIDANDIGYFVNISLNTYSSIEENHLMKIDYLNLILFNTRISI